MIQACEWCLEKTLRSQRRGFASRLVTMADSTFNCIKEPDQFNSSTSNASPQPTSPPYVEALVGETSAPNPFAGADTIENVPRSSLRGFTARESENRRPSKERLLPPLASENLPQLSLSGPPPKSAPNSNWTQEKPRIDRRSKLDSGIREGGVLGSCTSRPSASFTSDGISSTSQPSERRKTVLGYVKTAFDTMQAVSSLPPYIYLTYL